MAFNETPNLLERTGTVSHFLFGVQFSCTVMADMQVLDICNDKNFRQYNNINTSVL